ncbi:DNA (cytosine-5)-methyltransferase 3A isoform X3 [Rhipicephalus microplus]|uniref:DNA (cytosine-5)-methyltransferase 3A isoform X3 n=1 Tax=Rhipicephalus microplus TaxID=6941 RepID=UPI003F6D744B
MAGLNDGTSGTPAKRAKVVRKGAELHHDSRLAQVGSLVWAQLGARTLHWPAVVLDAKLCHQKPAAKKRLWVCWLAEYRVSEVIVARSCTPLPDNTDLIAWFREKTSSLDAHVTGSVPTAVLKALRIPGPALPTRQSAQIAKEPAVSPQQAAQIATDLCIACDTALPLGDTCTQHPLVEGAICEDCRGKLLESLFAIAPDGTCAYCFICGNGDKTFICDNVDCGRCICSQCLKRLVGKKEPDKVTRCSPWHCNICQGRSAGRLRPWPDWEARVNQFFRNPQAVAPPVLEQLPRQSLRVLSLFDGIATGKYVLNQLGLSVKVYYASEVDNDAIRVGLTRHGSSITNLGPVEHLNEQKLKELCPIDLLIGGSASSDLANVIPNRKSLYDATDMCISFFEFYRVLRTILLANGETHLFWIFGSIVAMPREYRRIISRFLQCEPALLDACSFSAQARAMLFWGNIPAVDTSLNLEIVQSTTVQSIRHPLLKRKAAVAKVQTVKTNPTSLWRSKHGFLPVTMDEEGNMPSVTELEGLLWHDTFCPSHRTVHCANYQHLVRVAFAVWISEAVHGRGQYFAGQKTPASAKGLECASGVPDFVAAAILLPTFISNSLILNLKFSNV